MKISDLLTKYAQLSKEKDEWTFSVKTRSPTAQPPAPTSLCQKRPSSAAPIDSDDLNADVIECSPKAHTKRKKTKKCSKHVSLSKPFKQSLLDTAKKPAKDTVVDVSICRFECGRVICPILPLCSVT